MSNSLVLLLIYGWGKWADSRQLFCIKWLQIKPSCTYIRKFCKDDYQNLNFRVSPEELCSTSHSTKFLNGTSLSEWGCPECSAAARSSPGSPSWRGSQLWVIDLLYAHLGWYNTYNQMGHWGHITYNDSIDTVCNILTTLPIGFVRILKSHITQSFKRISLA